MPKAIKNIIFEFFVLGWIFIATLSSSASTTNGTIDVTNKYAWGSKIGWVNYGSANGNIQITDSAITGDVWNENYGWIKLNPTTGGVVNDGEGNLSGYAWNSSLGWLNFSGVTISTSGIFRGQATGENFGTVNFECDNCLVQTDWRPVSSRSISPPATVSVGGIAIPVSVSPSILIVTSTLSPTTTSQILNLQIVPATSTINRPNISSSSSQPSVISTIKESVMNILENGITNIISNLVAPQIPITQFSDKILPKLYAWLPNLLKQTPIEQQAPIEQFVSKETPLAMSGKWDYIAPEVSRRYVFAPLPSEFARLTQEFPSLNNTFEKVGIKRMADVQKMQSVKLFLPGLSDAIGLESVGMQTGEIEKIKRIPISDLSNDLKQKIPANIIFAQTAGYLVDYKIALSLTPGGKPEQKISTIAGKPMHLTIKPDKPVKRVRGFLIFRSRDVQTRAEVPSEGLLASWMSSEPVFAYDLDKPIPVEEKLVLQEFEYTDPDGDGIFTADIQSPLPVGEYEIITVMDYEDPDLGSKQIRLITVVDPEGYIFEKIDSKELRIPGAVVTLYHFNPNSKQYQKWPAEDYQQDNPQVTDVRGTYSFLVPGGTYYITVSAPGYIDYLGKPFIVEEGSNGVRTNIEMKLQNWWLKNIDWKTVLLVLVAILLVINFYKDKKREKNLIKK